MHDDSWKSTFTLRLWGSKCSTIQKNASNLIFLMALGSHHTWKFSNAWRSWKDSQILHDGQGHMLTRWWQLRDLYAGKILCFHHLIYLSFQFWFVQINVISSVSRLVWTSPTAPMHIPFCSWSISLFTCSVLNLAMKFINVRQSNIFSESAELWALQPIPISFVMNLKKKKMPFVSTLWILWRQPLLHHGLCTSYSQLRPSQM